MAIDILFELIEKGKYELLWSFILEYENSRNPFIERKLNIKSVSTLCSETIKPSDNIKLIAKDITKYSSTKNRDNLKDIIQGIKLYNPVDFLRKEMDIDVIE